MKSNTAADKIEQLENSAFHGPAGFESGYEGLSAYCASIRAFEDRTIRRRIIVVEADTVACQTRIEGTFVNEFRMSPARPLPANGAGITMDLIHIVWGAIALRC